MNARKMKITELLRPASRRRLLPGLLVIVALAAQMPTAAYVVTNSADGGDGSLRDALNAAVPAIDFSSNLLCHRIYLTNELVVGHDVIINGLGPAFLALDGNYDVLTNRNENHRIFHILPGRTVTISNLSMIHARVYDQSFAYGGAIFNEGVLTLDNCAVKGNFVSSAGASWGGAIYSSGGTLELRKCSLTGNAASGNQALGGGIFNRFIGNAGLNGVLIMQNCTVSGNTATAAAVPDISVDEIAVGGGIYTFLNDVGTRFTTTFINCTICSNSAWSLGRVTNSASRGGGLYVENGASGGDRCTLRNTLVAGNSARIFNSAAEGPDVWGIVTSFGINLIGITNGSTGWGADIVGGLLPANTPVDPKLGPLGYYGGQTLCHSLLPESQAIDHGDDSVVIGPLYLTTDQRGVQLGTTYARKVNAHVDIGAFETNKPTYYVFGCVAEPEFPHSLREILAEVSNGDKMSFSPDITGTYFTDGELVIDKSIDIVGLGAAVLTLSGDGSNRVFHVTSNATVNISGLTIANGYVVGANGSNGDSTNRAGGNGQDALGGGILNEGTLTLTDCYINANYAYGGSGGDSLAADNTNNVFAGGPGGSGLGGGIYNSGTLTLANCTVGSNRGTGGAGGQGSACTLPGCTGGGATGTNGLGAGGGIFNNGTLTMANGTVSGNVASQGGGIVDQGTSSLINCTIVGNSTYPGPGAGLYTAGASSIQNTIIALNIFNPELPSLNDVVGTVNSQGNNLISVTNGSSGWIAADIVGSGGLSGTPVNPMLGGFGYNGGQVPTYTLLAGSPALDAGNDVVLTVAGLTTDQRGRPRLFGAHVDIGAFESGGTVTVGVSSAAPTGAGSLYQAVADAYNGDTVQIGSDVTGVITPINYQGLAIARSINIAGPGARQLTVSGCNDSNCLARALTISSNATVSISGLTIANGASLSGGGIVNAGALTLTDCILSNNAAIGPAPDGFGGAVYNLGALTLDRCTVVSNTAALDGGGILNDGTLQVTNSTLAGNIATHDGGAIYHLEGSTILQNCTIASNYAASTSLPPGGGIYAGFCGGTSCSPWPPQVSALNCIIAANRAFGGDYAGPVVSLGYNLVGDGGYSIGFGTTGDQVGSGPAPLDPMLGPLQDNGGPTPTMALLPDSPAINRGYSPSLLLDQRGAHRPVYATLKLAAGDGSDIGAYERDGLLRITAIDRLAPTGINLSFWSELGSSYRMEQSPTLKGGAWSPLTDNVAGAGGVMQVTDPDSMQPQRFYRVRLLP
jgi:hypothetical protein